MRTSRRAVSSLLATLAERLQGRESLDLEFKAARSALPDSLWSTVSAFANTRGGWIVLGVAERSDSTTVEGIVNATAVLQKFCDLCRNSQKISYPVCGASDAEIEDLDGKQVIVLRVPAASRQVKPVFINGNPYTGTFVRRHAGDFRCTKPEVDRMMREASDLAADSAVLPTFGVDDLDLPTLARYRRRYQTLNPASPWNAYDDVRFLQAIGGIRHDRESGTTGVTVAGLLLAGTPEAIREWRSRHLVDYRLVRSESDVDRR